MSRIIVSMTSYGARLNTTAPLAIKSLNECIDYKPDVIVLYVAEQEKHLVTNQFKPFKNVQARFIPDYLSHKKFYALTEKEFIDDFIIIADDDLAYKPYFFIKLFNKFDEHKNIEKMLVCNRAQRVSSTPYHHTPFIMKDDPDSGRMVFGSGSGVLIPPHIMRFDKNVIEEGVALTPHCDECYYSAYAIKNNIQMFCTGKPQPFNCLPLPKEDPNGLWTKYNQFEKDTTFRKVFDYFKIDIDEKIFVSFTSWTKRIKYASAVVERMRKQTYPVEKIILTLSSDEFVNKEKDLPKDLVNMVGKDFEIRWVKENTYTFKKLEPLFYIHPEHWVLIIDDDVNYPENFVETMYNSIADGKQPITGSSLKTWYREYGNVLSANGAFTLIKPVHCLPYLKDMSDYIRTITNDIASDPVLTYSVFFNHLTFKRSKTDYRAIQAKGEGKYPSPYSGGVEGRKRNDRTHDLVHQYMKDKNVNL